MDRGQKQFITAQTMASAVASAAIPLYNIFGVAVQANYATGGTLGGVLALQASVDHREDLNGNVLQAGNWVTITGSPVTLTGAGSYIWNVSEPNYPFIRLIYTPTGGDTGTLNAFVNVKGF